MDMVHLEANSWGLYQCCLAGRSCISNLAASYPGFIYHATKWLDEILFQFYQKNYSLRITDLHQGIVWGTNTQQTLKDERLINRFDYDADYRTVLNRFLMQGALGVPLTVYGTGNQIRAFIYIQDTAKCISIAIQNPPQPGAQVEIFNQVAETYRVGDLAKIISGKTGCEIKNISNPRSQSADLSLLGSSRLRWNWNCSMKLFKWQTNIRTDVICGRFCQTYSGIRAVVMNTRNSDWAPRTLVLALPPRRKLCCKTSTKEIRKLWTSCARYWRKLKNCTEILWIWDNVLNSFCL